MGSLGLNIRMLRNVDAEARNLRIHRPSETSCFLARDIKLVPEFCMAAA